MRERNISNEKRFDSEREFVLGDGEVQIEACVQMRS